MHGRLVFIRAHIARSTRHFSTTVNESGLSVGTKSAKPWHRTNHSKEENQWKKAEVDGSKPYKPWVPRNKRSASKLPERFSRSEEEHYSALARAVVDTAAKPPKKWKDTAKQQLRTNEMRLYALLKKGSYQRAPSQELQRFVSGPNSATISEEQDRVDLFKEITPGTFLELRRSDRFALFVKFRLTLF
jgi:hypothetical protein